MELVDGGRGPSARLHCPVLSEVGVLARGGGPSMKLETTPTGSARATRRWLGTRQCRPDLAVPAAVHQPKDDRVVLGASTDTAISQTVG